MQEGDSNCKEHHLKRNFLPCHLSSIKH